MTTYLDFDAEQARIRMNHDRCPVCGNRPDKNGACLCRDCDTCGRFWLADTRAVSDFGNVKKEECPACQKAEAA